MMDFKTYQIEQNDYNEIQSAITNIHTLSELGFDYCEYNYEHNKISALYLIFENIIKHIKIVTSKF